MQTLVLCLMVAVSLSTLLKLSLATLRVRWSTFALCALFLGLSWPWAVEQSKTQIEAWLANTDVALLLAYCWRSAKVKAPHGTSRSIAPNRYALLLHQLWHHFLAIYPGLLIFPVLFSLEVTTIFALPGIDFSLVAWGLAIVVALSLIVVGYGLEYLLPERELRLELLFLLNVLIAILGVIATVNGRTAVASVGNVDLNSLLAVIALFLFFAFIGFVWSRRRSKC